MNLHYSKTQDFAKDFWSTLSIPIKTPSLSEIAEMFKDLYPKEPQVGIDQDKQFYDDIEGQIKTILDTKSILKAKLLARKGIPCGSRAQIWDLILQTDFVDDFKAYVRH